MKWLKPPWWEYLLTNCTGWTNFICRIKGHPCGVVYYNSTGLEPDMHCKNCGEDLG